MRGSTKILPRTFSSSFMVAVCIYLLFAGFSTTAFANANLTCTWCHTKPVHTESFPESVHKDITCATCHTGLVDMYLHKAKEEKSVLLSCESCHKEVEEHYKNDVHLLQKQQNCISCHKDLHNLKKSDPTKHKAAVIATCTTECHKELKDMQHGHAASVLKGNNDSASCTDCHALHETNPVKKGATPEQIASNRKRQTETCIECHSDPEVIKRNKLNAHVVDGFTDTYHGKALGLGSGNSYAGCADCHSDHITLKADQPLSPIHPDNRAATCGKCHNGFSANFTDFIAHPDHTDSKQYPVLYWTTLFMECLLFSVFILFGMHTLLWWRKAYWQKWKTGPGKTVVIHDPVEENQFVQRFALKYRIMHILLVTSFLILTITGMPVKYSSATWAGFIMNILGGPAIASMLHKSAATVLIILFLYVAGISLKYLFRGDNGAKGWLTRLIGPESLCPNKKDWQDIKAMFRWFFGKGEMPGFERWTYFEKFDFFAVFWGMIVIGGSGLIMAFPEMFSYVLPGWFINAASIAHSEEALLAAIFIFTVHFFHNHLAPNKFPMEDNVFTGRYTLADMKHERPDEYERVVAEGRLDEIKTDAPGIGIKLFSAIFGYAAVIVGLVLTVLIIWAIIQ